MIEQMKDNYGMPTEHSGDCPIDTADLVQQGAHHAQEQCTATWRRESQVIELENAVFVFDGKPEVLYFISYDHPHSAF